MKYWLILIGVYLISCSSDLPEVEDEFIYSINIDSNITVIDSVKQEESSPQTKRTSDTINNDYLACYLGIALGVGTHNDSLFNSFIHNNYGLYVIESFGAMPMIRKFHNIGKFNTSVGKKSINELLYLEMGMPIFESLPKVICDTTIYDKQGCFAEEINPLLASQIWNYASLNEKQIQAIEFLVETVKMTVINTSNFTFYFSKIEGKWYLTFLDLRTPCSA